MVVISTSIIIMRLGFDKALPLEKLGDRKHKRRKIISPSSSSSCCCCCCRWSRSHEEASWTPLESRVKELIVAPPFSVCPHGFQGTVIEITQHTCRTWFHLLASMELQCLFSSTPTPLVPSSRGDSSTSSYYSDTVKLLDGVGEWRISWIYPLDAQI